MAGIQFSAEALQAYKNEVVKQLAIVEDTCITALKEGGLLNLEPAYGNFPEAVTALNNYKTHHGSIWGDLQGLKAALEAVDEACKTTLGNYDKTETDNTADA